MRKLIAILLGALVGLTVSGYQLVFHYQIQLAKAHMKTVVSQKKTSSSFLTEYKLARTQFAALNWKDDGEFSLEGSLYDVVSIDSSSDVFTIQCINDRQETEVVSAYMQAIRNTGLPDPLKNVIKLSVTPFLLPSIACVRTPEFVRLPESGEYAESLSAGKLSERTPPPDGPAA